jgi:hypothetical protein
MMQISRVDIELLRSQSETWKLRLAIHMALIVFSATAAVYASGCNESYHALVSSHIDDRRPSIVVPAPPVASANQKSASTDSGTIPSMTGNQSAAPSEGASGAVAPSVAEPKVCTNDDARKWIAVQDRYNASIEDLPSANKADEYKPIEAIQAFYAQVSGSSKHGSFGVQDHFRVETDASKIVIMGGHAPVIVQLSEKQIKVGRRTFYDRITIALFRSLGQLLTDLGKECKQQGVRGIRLRTRGYKDTARVEFSYGAVVVTLRGFSNNPDSPLHSYGLDIVEPKHSLTWVHE